MRENEKKHEAIQSLRRSLRGMGFDVIETAGSFLIAYNPTHSDAVLRDGRLLVRRKPDSGRMEGGWEEADIAGVIRHSFLTDELLEITVYYRSIKDRVQEFARLWEGTFGKGLVKIKEVFG